MSFMLLMMEAPGKRQARPLEEGQKAYERMMAFQKTLQDKGVLVAGEALKPDDNAIRIESINGRRTVSDGPFAESKEIIGGFFLLNCKSREDALEYAHMCPMSDWGIVELREIANSCFE
ncbi:YciI family protein [Myxococcus fulvus]|uniref:YciI family protein n=1 Tax=Myxococcus fulvus TaxID=33 RepID=UPI003B996013